MRIPRGWRVILIALILVSTFLMGYFNVEVSMFFLNQRALIGLLTVFATLIFIRLLFLINEHNKRKRYLERELYEMRTEVSILRNTIDYKNKIADRDARIALLEKQVLTYSFKKSK